MNSLARTTLRLSLAGAGVVVLGAGVVGHAQAVESPGSSDDTNAAATDAGPAEDATPAGAPEGLVPDELTTLAVPDLMYVEAPNISLNGVGLT